MKPPLADPRGEPHLADGDVRVFRVRLWPYFFLTFSVELVLILPILGAILYPVFTRHPERFPVAMAAITGVEAAFTLLICVLFYCLAPLQVDESGLRAPNSWGVPCHIAWSQIASVKYRWLLYPYAIASTEKKGKLWVILLLQDPRGFARAVASHTAPDHPLHAFLRGRGLLE